MRMLQCTSAIILLLASGSAVAESAPALSVADMKPGERISIDYQGSGCFHNETAKLEITADGARVSGNALGDAAETIIPLTSEQRRLMDTFFSRLKSGSLGGGCTTTDSYIVSAYHGEALIGLYSGIDASCTAGLDPAVLSPGQIVVQLRSKASAAARAKAAGE